MKATETLIYTNTATNQSISISFLSNLIPTAFEEDVDASFYTDKNSGQDGETLQNLDLEPREITIKAVFQADSNYRLFEKHIKSVFNPKTEGLLKYSDGEYTKSIFIYKRQRQSGNGTDLLRHLLEGADGYRQPCQYETVFCFSSALYTIHTFWCKGGTACDENQ